MSNSLTIFLIATVACLTFSSNAFADRFGSGTNQFEMEFVTIGEPNNADDDTQWGDIGSVPYTYRMGKHEVSEHMIRTAIADSLDEPFPLDISLDERHLNGPATSVSWLEAARFVNWLNTDAGYSPAYKFRESVRPTLPADGFELWEPSDPGYDEDNPYRNRLARYVLPTVDEWHKAAFYNDSTGNYSDFATGTNEPMPVASGTDSNTAVYRQPDLVGPSSVFMSGGPSSFGTVGQGGNVWEWQESSLSGIHGINSDPFARRMIRGGDWTSSSNLIDSDSLTQLNIDDFLPSDGFRVASVPEPSVHRYLIIGIALCILRKSSLVRTARDRYR